ncbi:MAG: nucleotidyltransferase domain-containing protein, partial [Paraglaciecola polaris]
MSLQTLINKIHLIQSTDDIPAFKACISDNYLWLESEFPRVDVDSLVLGRATFVDALLCHAWQLLELHKESKIALVAVGGYGRGQLQPYSDIDLLLLSPSALSQAQQD